MGVELVVRVFVLWRGEEVCGGWSCWVCEGGR